MIRADQRPTTLIFAVLAALALAAVALALYAHPTQAQDGSAPDKPRGLEATASQDAITLAWDDPGDDTITGYMILRRLRYNDPSGHFDELVSDTGTATTAYTDDTVEADTDYTYRIKAINEHGVRERSRWYHISTPAPPVPDRPRGLSAAAFHDHVTLTWNDPQDDSITGYVILRRVRVNDQGGDFSVLVANTGTATTTYTDGAVAAETPYTYRIKAINQYGVSERSRWLHIDTPAAPVAPAAQQNTQESADPPTATEPADGDFAASTETTGRVAMGESIVGRISAAGDVDWILVQADPGQWFTITLTGYGEGDHTALETPHQKAYHRPDGSVLVSEHALNKDRPHCSSGCTHVEVSQAGSRYVAVASLVGNNTQNTGSYRLSVMLERAHEGVDGGVDLALDVSNDVDTWGFLRMLTPEHFPGFNPSWNRVFGAIPPHDVDWYRVDLEAGETYRFGLRQSDADLRLRLRDSTGTIIDSIGPGRAIHAVACAEGAHYIEVFRPDDAPLDITNYVVEAAYTDGLATKALRGNLPNTGQVQLYWQCYGIADSPPGPVPARRPMGNPLHGRRQPLRHRAGVSQRRICRQGHRPAHRRTVRRLRVPHHAGGGRRGDDGLPRRFHRGNPRHSRQPAGRLEPPLLPRRSHLRMGRHGGRQRGLRGPGQRPAGRAVDCSGRRVGTADRPDPPAGRENPHQDPGGVPALRLLPTAVVDPR